MKFGTKVIHGGLKPEESTGAVMPPIFQTSTYAQEAPGVHKGFEYARTKNPTRSALESNLASIENGTNAICFSSGMAATDGVMKLFQQGDEIISTNDLYGGTYRAFTKMFSNFGLQFHFVPMHDIACIEAKITSKTKMIWVETPTNPMLNIIDIQAVCDLAKSKGLLVCVDNTFATPALQNPLDLGADIVLHSATKYLGGHSDSIHGTLIVKNQELADLLYFIQNGTGAIPGPMDCFLILRGIKTLKLRMDQHCKSAARVAAFLKDHNKVDQVYYPGLTNHPGHEIAKKQMSDFGGMVSFSLKNDSLEAAVEVMKNTHYFTLAESLGGVESLIGHPATMTHASIPLEERLKTGIVDSLIRLSVGIEDIDDLLQDLDQAIK